MSKHKYTTAACIIIVIAILALTVAFMFSSNWGVTVNQPEPEYADKLFRTDMVHTIDIVIKESDWEDMITNAQAEEYIQASVVIDGETISGIGIRPKGNSSLAMIQSSDSDRYSFKIEFDHFSESISYHGLDKLALNNIAQDNTYMKDYISYQMMNEMGADAPLSSFIWVTVNGKDWGLYLAAEGVEESFAQRVYGKNFGEIYKPDTMDMNDGGGFGDDRGEGNFPGGEQRPNFGGENGKMPQMPDFSGKEGEMPQMPDFSDEDGEMPQMPDFSSRQDGTSADENGQTPNMGGGFGWFGDSSTSLVYTDDDPNSYSAIFDNSVFDTSEADKKRLIESLNQLNTGDNIGQVVNVDEVIRYFVVHNFVLNSDSYTGSLTHNYYLAENDGKLSMIAWDYNLSFGGMGGFDGGMARMFDTNSSEKSGTTTDTATTLVNYPIDSPMLSGTIDSKPMISWIFNNDENLTKYHEVFAVYMEYFNSGKFAEMYDNAISLISPYVEKDPTAFCSYEDFIKGSTTLREFCLLRAESINGQLDGTIASTSEEQTATNKTGFINASAIDLNSMGSNSIGFGRARNGQSQNFMPPDDQGALPDVDSFTSPNGQSDFSIDGYFPQMNLEGSKQFGTDSIPKVTQEVAGLNNGNNVDRAFSNMNMRSDATSTSIAFSTADVVLMILCVMVLICGILYAKKRKT